MVGQTSEQRLEIDSNFNPISLILWTEKGKLIIIVLEYLVPVYRDLFEVAFGFDL